MPVHLENEAELVAGAKAGDAEAFTTLVRQYDRNIYRLAMNITSNKEDAEDVLQETFLKAYTKLEQFQGNARFHTWLVRIAVNEGLMKLRKRRGDKTVPLDQPFETADQDELVRELEAWDDNPEQTYAREELRSIVNEAIGSLEPTFRSVVQLRDVEDLSTEETAEMLGLSVPAVKSRLLRGRLKLREKLNRHFRRGARA
ncbi:MAG: sigma-70 family RNA polymerase sigma factor [Terriglobia bacterium]